MANNIARAIRASTMDDDGERMHEWRPGKGEDGEDGREREG